MGSTMTCDSIHLTPNRPPQIQIPVGALMTGMIAEPHIRISSNDASTGIWPLGTSCELLGSKASPLMTCGATVSLTLTRM